MEPTPHYSLPFRLPDTGTAETWPAQNQSSGIYAIVSPEQHEVRYSQQLSYQPPPYSHPQLHPQKQLHQRLHGTHHHIPGHEQHSNAHHHDHYPSPFPALHTAGAAPVSPCYPLAGHTYSVIPPEASNSMARGRQPSILPRPAAILPSQDTAQGPCLACGRVECHLSSHWYFSRHILDSAKKRKQQQPLTAATGRQPAGDTTPRPTTTVPVSLTSPRTGLSSSSIRPSPPTLVLDAERQRLLQLWYRPWCLQPQSQARSLPPERHVFPTPFIDRVLPDAQYHQPLLHALLAYSGTLASLAATDPDLTSLAARQQTFAVDLLSQACPNEEEASSDAAMLAATLLMLVYMAQGNAFEVQKHVSGLVHLCKIRGGMHYLGLRGLVAECLLWADHMAAIWLGVAPVWGMTLPPVEVDVKVPMKFGNALQRSIAEADSYAAGTGGGAVGQAASLGLAMDIMIAFRCVCRVADVIDFAIPWGGGRYLPREAQNGFGYLSGIAEFQLARCHATYQQSGSINECVCLALILFHHAVLRSEAAVTPLLIQAEYRFWTILKAFLERENMGDLVARLCIWMCLTGLSLGILSRSGGEDTKFWSLGVQKLREASKGAGLTSWEELRRDVLEDFVWISAVQEETFGRAWMEAQAPSRSHMNGNVIDQRGNWLPPGG